jgi:hypothetical protein
MIKIITHPGTAHFDEFMAISLILASNPNDEFEIERRIPTEAELSDRTIWVIDVGGKYESHNLNFDHHQDSSLGCSYFLIAEFLGIDKKAAEIFSWWAFKNHLDLNGIESTAEHFGIDKYAIKNTVSPIEELIIIHFASQPNNLKSFMKLLGENILKSLKEKDLQFAFFDNCFIEKFNDKNSYIFIENHSNRFIQLWLEKHSDIIIIISDNDRTNGYSMSRVGNNCGVDFRKIEHLTSEIAFVHNSGFLAVTHEKVPFERLKELINLSI